MTWCRSFIAVYDVGGFSAAARALHRSQSRVSGHVAALEKLVGEQLLHRDVHPPTLTAAGEAFLPYARGVTDEWTAGLAAVGLRRGEVSGTVAIGSVPSVSSQILAPLFAEFGRRYPGVRFEVHEGPTTWLDDALAHRTIEIALRPSLEVRPHAPVERRVLFTDPFMVVLRADHPLAQCSVITLDQLKGFPMLTTGEAGLDSQVGAEYRQVLDSIGIDRERSMTVTQPTTVFAFVEASLGLGLIGSLTAQMINSPALVRRPLDAPDGSREFAAYWASTRRLSPAASVFLAELVDFTRDRHVGGQALSPSRSRGPAREAHK